MRISGLFQLFRFSLCLAAAVPSVATAVGKPSNQEISRQDLSGIVSQILKSMEAHDPGVLPLATVYKATENSHAASLAMMTSWRTIVKAESPSLLAIDTEQGSAFFITDISEGNGKTEAILRGRVKVVDQRITELELFINRSRGDDGYAFSATELSENYKVLMSPPKNREKASRTELEAIGAAAWDSSDSLSVSVGDNCQFTEVGATIIDTGTYGNDSTAPLTCSWSSTRPTDLNARTSLVIDEELGFIVTNGVVQGKVYPYYGNISTFIPDSMTSAQEAQEVWFAQVKSQGNVTLVSSTEATGENFEVLQFYDNALQALQFHVFLSGPNMTSSWV
ncbi:uncharacterized protein N7496_000347 [Penicillium cataractarum]|uniref:Uncharacterized protein n=1 Tax=Penicillium cataractarum TaxID=2100454 RepID=A0A9W9VUC0_9EURO|nr:uncharacterized protein N7496_000347 [Penicillium cataractarum]KAJ5389279.1 hypothetical protein N7496_000347 [Penicillium cataractarum]